MKKTNWLLFIIIVVIILAFSTLVKSREGFINVEDDFKEFSWGHSERSEIPNVIWTFWDGPKLDVVEMCIDSWRKYNPNYKINVITKKTVPKYLPEVNIEKLPRAVQDGVQKYSDFVRVHLLEKYGGIWADASIICHHPFTWVNAIQNHFKCEYIGYYLNGFVKPEYKSYSPVIENWFFACVPHSKFVRDWRDEFIRSNHYPSAQDYVDSVVNSGVNIQNINNVSYLSMHVAAQKVFQTHKNDKDRYNLCLFMAEKSAYKHLHKNKFEVEPSLDLLVNPKTCKDYYKYPFIKIRGDERKVLEHYKNKKNAFS